MHYYNRRKFIKLSAGVTGGLLLSSSSSDMPIHETFYNEKKIAAFGLQLYTLRDDMLKDPNGVLKQVASSGYKQIESYEGPKGMFWGMTNIEFKKLMDALNMTIISSHCDINKNFEKKAADAAAIGMKYLICPSIDAQKKADDYKKMAEQFNQCGEICKKTGIKFGYHNHDHDFKVVDGQIAQDIYMQHTDPALVDFQMDIYWVVTAGQDPESWLKKYKNRFRLCHIKDRIKRASERDASCNLGEGSIDFANILKTAKQNGMQYYIVEQERYDGTTPMKAIETDAGYMRKLKI